MTGFDPRELAEVVTTETGLAFTGSSGSSGGTSYWYELVPSGYSASATFKIHVEIGWRRINSSFKLGNFAGDLLQAIRHVDNGGRKVFLSVLNACREDGADVVLRLNGALRDYWDEEVWSDAWRTFDFSVNKGMLPINMGDVLVDRQYISHWACRIAAASLALLPVEEDQVDSPEMSGFPEGGRLQIEVNRYERDRRNRAAAIAIHGHVCHACGVDMQDRYGFVAEGLIEVHHVVPVSLLGPEYMINPKTDLVPLCPTCHAVAHRRSPPFSVSELRAMLSSKPEEVDSP